MGKAEMPKIEELSDEMDFWNAYRGVYRAKGLDIARLYAEWAAELEKES